MSQQGAGPGEASRHDPLLVPASPIPTFRFTKPPLSVGDLSSINSVATAIQDVQAQVVAENAVLRLIYGRVIVGAQVADILAYAGSLVVLVVWGHGPINAVEAYYLDDLAAPSGVTPTHYTGTQVVADPTLVAAYAAQSPAITYTDVLAGIAYSVFVIPPNVTSGFPRITAIIQGLKVYDPRSTLTVYSDNPALVLADLQTNTTYGAAGAINWTSVGTVADACDGLVGGEKRRTIGLCMDQVQPLTSWFEALRTYAGCWLVRDGSSLKLIADRPAASSFTFSEATPCNARVRNVKKRSRRDVPTVVIVRYTDTSAIPWRDGMAYAYATGVLAGTVPWKVREVALPGITRYSQGVREAIEQLNKLALSDLTCDIDGQDEALAVTIGDVTTVTANVGLAAKLMRVINQATPQPGRPTFNAEEYDPAVYSDSVQAAPSYADTNLPNPNAPPAVTGLTLTEELFQVNASGLYFSRIKAVWVQPASFPTGFTKNYRIEVSLAGAIIYTATPASAEYRSGQVQEGNTYNVNVWLISNTGAQSPVASASINVTGNPAVPGDVANFTARAIGGRIFMTWTFNGEKDIADYEMRYGVANDWDAGTIISRTAGAQYIADGLPAGTWYFMIKARNLTRTTTYPNGRYSANAGSVQVVLAIDTSLLVRALYTITTPALTNMTEYHLAGDATRYFITDIGDGVGYGADNTNNSIGTFGDSLVNRVLAAPHTSATSEWLSETYDYGQALFGDWNFTGNITALDGSSYVATLQTKVLIGDAWTDNTTFPARVSARYARLKIQATALNTMLVKMDPNGPAISLDVAYKSESFTVTTSAVAAATVTLQGKYSLYKAIPMSPKGTVAKMAVYNNVSLSPTGSNTFDVYAFDDTGAQIAVEVTGTFQGI